MEITIHNNLVGPKAETVLIGILSGLLAEFCHIEIVFFQKLHCLIFKNSGDKVEYIDMKGEEFYNYIFLNSCNLAGHLLCNKNNLLNVTITV